MREPPARHRGLTAYERRARVIAQLRERALVEAESFATRPTAIPGKTGKSVRWQEPAVWFLIGGMLFWGACSVFVLYYVVSKGI
jgi:hypothetical protein